MSENEIRFNKPANRSRTSFRVATIFGIEIRLHLSLLVIFVLVTYSLARVMLPGWHPDWSAVQLWSTSLIASVLFFASLLAHELSHSLVAIAHGIKVPRITLFLFGGMAEIENEAPTPKIEFLMAGAGPLMSLFLGFLFLSIAEWLAPPDLILEGLAEGANPLAELSSAASIALWLGSINLILAIFNLVPGFPLDGGRLFRAALWWRHGDYRRATERAAAVGKGFGWLLVAVGAFQVFSGDPLGGLWLILIGWFLTHLAAASVADLLFRRALHGFRVRDAMRTRFDTVHPDTSIDSFIDDYLLRSNQLVWPVRQNDKEMGLISLAEVSDCQDRGSKRVYDVMRPVEQFLAPDTPGFDAIRSLADFGDESLPVVDANGRVIGLLHRADVLKWLSLHGPEN